MTFTFYRNFKQTSFPNKVSLIDSSRRAAGYLKIGAILTVLSDALRVMCNAVILICKLRRINVDDNLCTIIYLE